MDISVLYERFRACADAVTPSAGVARALRDDTRAYAEAFPSPVAAAALELAAMLHERALAYKADPDDVADQTLWLGRVVGGLRVLNAVTAQAVEGL